MEKKRFWMRGGVTGFIIGIIISAYFLSQNSCIGLFANPDGTFGTNCPQGAVNIFISNLKSLSNVYFSVLITIVLFVVCGTVGWIYGRFKYRNTAV